VASSFRRIGIVAGCMGLAASMATAEVPAPPGLATQPATAPAVVTADVPAPAGPATVTPAASELLDRVAKAYAGVTSLELNGVMTVDLDVGDAKEQHAPTFTATFAAPNLFRHAMTGDALVGGTGSKVYIYLPQFNAYYLRDIPVAPEGATRPGVTSAVDDVLRRQNLSLLLTLAPDPKQLVSTWFLQLDRAPDETIDGVAMPALLGSDPMKDVTIAFDPKTLLVRRVSFDLRKQFQQRGEDQARRAMLVVDYTTTRPGSAPTEPAAYAWAPPDGAREATDDVARKHHEHASEALLNRPAPPFTAKTLDGKTVSLADYRGKVVVIAFWATWCPPCMAELPHVQGIYPGLKAKGVEVLAVNLAEDDETVKAAVDEQQWTFPVLMDPSGEIAGKLSGTPPPVTFVVGRDGVITAVFPGYDEQQGTAPLRAAVEKALAR